MTMNTMLNAQNSNMRYKILACILALVSVSVKGQKTLDGFYSEVTGIASDDWNSFIFYPNQSFFFEKNTDFGDYQGYGTYELTYDSIILRFQEVPEDLRYTRVIEGPARKGGTLIQVRDGINPNEQVMAGGSLYLHDSLLYHVGADIFGNIYLDSGLTDVKLTINGFSPIPTRSSRFYGTQHIELDHTNGRSIIVMFAYKPVGAHFIEGGKVVKLKSRVLQGGRKLRKVFHYQVWRLLSSWYQSSEQFITPGD